MNKYDVVVGIEVHVELKTKTKMFSNAPVTFDQEPNSKCNFIDLGYPGSMPSVNKRAIELGVILGKALNMKVASSISFDRKNYYYPDLPKGFQITQQYNPIGRCGSLDIRIENKIKTINITRAHLEEDTAKQIHNKDNGITLIDFNRCGNPLIEIVSEPEMNSAKEAALYVKKLQNILLYANISDVKMENGSMRCDANVSLKLKGALKLGVKVEIKNINSISNLETAINNEIEIQTRTLDNNETVVQVTKRYDDDLKNNIMMRSKGDAVDYRYIPESNILPISLDKEWVTTIQKQLPLLPDFYFDYYLQKKINLKIINQLINNKDINLFFYECILKLDDHKKLTHWILMVLNNYLNDQKITINDTKLNSDNLVKMIKIIENGIISLKQGEKVFAELLVKNIDPKVIIKELNLSQISDIKTLELIIKELIAKNPNMVAQFSDRKERAMKFFIGQVMKATKGSANPQIVSKIVEDFLKK